MMLDVTDIDELVLQLPVLTHSSGGQRSTASRSIASDA
jgi:hypothetical protein